jgi:SAM-dependent methyltransferase
VNPEGGDPRLDGAWERYWRAERLASCGGEGGRPYQAAIAAYWERIFDELPAPVSLLDLCCGNGALALLAWRRFRARGLEASVCGVDRAPIDPARWLPRERGDLGRIRFCGGVAAEDLPFSPGSFTAVVGQYALEYTDAARTLDACRRVLAPGGTLAFVLHAREGVVARAAAAQREDAARLRRLGYFAAAERLARRHERGGAEAREAARFFALKDRALAELARGAGDPGMIANAGSVIRDALAHLGRVPTAAVLAKIAEVAEHVGDHEARIGALLGAARTREDVARLFAPLTAQGFRAVGGLPEALDGPHGLLGWAVRLADDARSGAR